SAHLRRSRGQSTSRFRAAEPRPDALPALCDVGTGAAAKRAPRESAAPKAGYPAAVPERTRLNFWGVRGSTPCDGPRFERSGGTTSCVGIDADGHPPVLFDLGTGLRNYGEALAGAGRLDGFEATVLLTHLHWDHIQGLPFFLPLAAGGGTVDVY